MSHDRVALITGASRGLGRALAIELAAEGWTIAAVARRDEPLTEVIDVITARGGRAHAISGDIADPHVPARIAGRAAALGTIELLIHAASTLGPVPLRPILDVTPDELDRVLQTNVVGPFRLTRAIAGSMAIRGRGTVLFVSSDAAVEAYPGWGAYGLSKAAADHLARTLAVEIGSRGVRVHAVDPGEMDTDMHADAFPDADRATLADPAVVARKIVARLADPIDTVRFVVGAS
jgi:NAD(P)-dependent dehydrogenase (short-subunit alcohol dehydrogenase family)